MQLVVFLALYASTETRAANVTNAELLKACGEKTVVMGRDEDKKLVRAGEKINGFCSGYIQATFSGFTATANCKSEDASPEFLLSVYEQYVKDKAVPGSATAYSTLMQAFRRVPDCE
ncbi:MAG: hypothetical protein WC809_20925 [Sinimarinibacterium sp.]